MSIAALVMFLLPGLVNVTANPSGLKAGAYRGTVTFSFGTIVRAVSVTLIVQPAGSSDATDPVSLSRLNPATPV